MVEDARVLAAAKRAALAANPHQVKATLPRDELVVYVPTYRPSTSASLSENVARMLERRNEAFATPMKRGA
ncbi:MAG: hypothetical protein ACKV2T_05975 [Kofleriaceae bacterium]